MAIEKIIEVKVVSTGFEQVTKETDDLTKSTKKLENEQENLQDTMKDGKQGILDNGGAIGILNELTGGLASTVKDAVEATALFTKESKIGALASKAYAIAVGTSTGAMKLFRLALVATGIGAIVVGIVMLIQNFDKLKTAVYNLIPGLKLVGDFFSGLVNSVTDFIGVTSQAGREMDELAEKAKKSSQINADFLATDADKYDKFTKQKIDSKEKYNAAIIALNEDETKSDKEKAAQAVKLQERLNRDIAAADAARAKEKKDARDKEAKEEADAAKTRKEKADAALAKSAQEELNRVQKVEDLKKKILDAQDDETAKTDEEKFRLMQERAQQELDNLKATAEEKQILQAELNLLQAEQLETFRADQKDKKDKADAETQAKEKADSDKKIADDKAEKDKLIAQEQAVADAKLAITNQGLDVAAKGIQIITSLAGKNRKLQAAGLIAENAVGIAKIVVNTQAANAGATLKYAAIPGGAAIAAAEIALNNISAGIGIAASIAATAKGLKALKEGGDAGSGSASSGGAGGGTQRVASAPSFNLAQGTTQGAVIAGQTTSKQPIKAFVVSSDVTSQQQLDLKTQTTATF